MVKIKNNQLGNSKITNLSTEIFDMKKIEIDFRYFCFKSINYGTFTNFLSNEEEHFKLFNNIFKNVLPYFKNKTFQDTDAHCHNLKNKVIEIKKILKYYSSIGFDIMDLEIAEDNSFHQLGTPGSIRMIGYRANNVFYLFFLDPHHLLYPSKHYNNHDYSLYSYSDSISYIGTPVIKECISEKCYDCEHIK